MGNKQSSEMPSANAGSAAPSFNWGAPPEFPPENEVGTEDLALQAWATCKARPTPAKHYRSDAEEKLRRAGLAWRKRQSFMELDCGDDSFFVSNTYRTIGLADGVGGWKEDGYDSAAMSNSVMQNAKLYCETHRDSFDPEVIMQQAFDKVVNDKKVKAGSTTACIASLRQYNPSQYYLDIANLGDCGLMVVRNGELVHRIHEKVHGLTSPFQLSVIPKGFKHNVFADLPCDSVRETIDVKQGDVVVLGSDGLFDNRFTSDLINDAAAVGAKADPLVTKIPILGMLFGGALAAKTENADPYRVVQRMVADAYRSSIGKNGDTPWGSLLREFGVKSVEGGKIDDITVVLAKVTTRADMLTTDVW